MHRLLLFFLVIGWSTAIHAGPKEDAVAAYEKLFEYFTTDNHDQLVTVFCPLSFSLARIIEEATRRLAQIGFDRNE